MLEHTWHTLVLCSLRQQVLLEQAWAFPIPELLHSQATMIEVVPSHQELTAIGTPTNPISVNTVAKLEV